MKSLLSVLAFVVTASRVLGDLLVPSSVPISTQVFSDTVLSTSGPRQYQQYIAAGEFSPDQLIYGLQVRLPATASAWPVSDVTFSSYSIVIGEASDALAAAHGVFDPAVPFLGNFNTNANPVLVYSGTLAIPAGSYQPGQYGPQIRFNQAPYLITSGNGLVVYITHSGGTPSSAGGLFSTVDTSSNPAVSSAVSVNDNTSLGWGVSGQVAAPFALSLVEPRLLNLSTRATVGTGANILIGGFIVTGPTAKKVLIRAIGPGLATFGVANVLADPQLVVRDATSVVASNDNWQTQAGGAGDVTAIQATGLAPGDPRESAILTTLNPGAYTALVSGAGGTSGNALVEVYDLDSAAASTAVNISTRASVQTGDSISIAGFQVRNGYSQPFPFGANLFRPVPHPNLVLAPVSVFLVIRGLGPSLTALGVPGALQNPTLTLVDEAGQVLDSNDDWQTGAGAENIIGFGLAPSDPRESAIYTNLPDGNYTCLLRGVNGTTGVGLIEVYVNPTPQSAAAR